MKSDQQIVDEIKKGNKRLFAQLVARHQRVILRTVLRMTRDLGVAEDVTQESFIKAYQKLHTFEGRSSFKSWLFQIAINTARNKLRGNKRDFVEVDKVSLAVQDGLEAGVYESDVKSIVLKEVHHLPEKQKMALSLRIFDDLSFKEIAEIMDCPYDTAKANYHHALLKLRHRFQDSETLKELGDFTRHFSIYDNQRIAEVKG